LPRDYHECSVCGRKFPVGQGIVLSKSGFTLYFHSSKCASKFLKLLLERMDENCARTAIREVLEELDKLKASNVKEKKI
jgi:large subunit ribosomal protein L24e